MSENLIRAATQARSMRGHIVVVKLGGSAMEDPVATRGTLQSVATLRTLGMNLILVHGGGKPIDRAMQTAGLTPKKVLGRRYTDDATLQIVVDVLQELNAGLVRQLEDLDELALGFNGESDTSEFPLHGERLMLPGLDLQPVDLGRVGKVTRVNADALREIVEIGREIPVIPSLAIDTDGGWLNVNADTVASAVAGALQAESVFFLTDTPGVLRTVTDPASLFARLTRRQCEQLLTDGVIAGGMIPKVEACFDALDAGAKRAVILDGRQPYALLNEFVSDRVLGTEIVHHESHE